jgi:hypothetical protein
VKTARHDMIASIADHDDAIADKFWPSRSPARKSCTPAIRA